MRGSVQGFGPGASPPMQLTQGHSALTLCEIGELRHHVGWWEDWNAFPMFLFFPLQFKFTPPYVAITLIGA